MSIDEYMNAEELASLDSYQRDRWRDLVEGFDAGGSFASIPERMRGPIIRWVIYRIPPGHFLSAVLKNDLHEAVSRADDENVAILHNWIRFLYNYVPAECWGSPDTFYRWMEGTNEIQDSSGDA